ncbi:MAG: GNAT family protein [Candidatus Bathyarchaeota archaeon]|nr:GNAT family protein [Candidatus Bathyarchaeota archaeon]
MLEGKHVNLRRAEKDDVSLVAQRWSNSQYMGEYQDVMKLSKAKMEKVMLEQTIFFIIEKKDGTKIGHIGGWMYGKICMEIGFALVLGERGKGYGTEAIQMMVNYLFPEKDIVRIQAPTDTENTPCQKALEKAGFTNEGTMRKSHCVRGEYRDMSLYSFLRDEWEILAETTASGKQHY